MATDTKTKLLKFTHSGADVSFFNHIIPAKQDIKAASIANTYTYTIYSSPKPDPIPDDPDEVGGKKRFFDEMLSNLDIEKIVTKQVFLELKWGEAEYQATAEVDNEKAIIKVVSKEDWIISGTPTINRVSLIIEYISDNPNYRYQDKEFLDKMETHWYEDPAMPTNLYVGSTAVQSYEANGFSSPVDIPGYQDKGQAMRGFKKGTVPKAGTLHELDSYTVPTGTTDADESIWKKTIWKDNSGTLHIGNKSYSLDNLKNNYYCGDDGIIWLGIILVGAGGAGGDHKNYGTDNSCKENYYAPGSGGGGGGIIWGVVNIAQLNNETKKFIIEIGIGGITEPGTGGTATTLSFYDGENTMTLAVAYGGSGGLKGSKSGTVNGGSGGSYWYDPNKSNYFKYLTAITGTAGTGYYYDGNSVSYASSINTGITFFSDRTSEKTLTTTVASSSFLGEIDMEQAKNNKAYRESISAYGGNSFGGGGALLGSSSQTSTWGGGGCGLYVAGWSILHGWLSLVPVGANGGYLAFY